MNEKTNLQKKNDEKWRKKKEETERKCIDRYLTQQLRFSTNGSEDVFTTENEDERQPLLGGDSQTGAQVKV